MAADVTDEPDDDPLSAPIGPPGVDDDSAGCAHLNKKISEEISSTYNISDSGKKEH